MPPLPKPRGARLGHDMGKLDSAAGTKQLAAGEQRPVPPGNEEWHPYALGWYRSLNLSGQSAEYEASDWALAYTAAEMLSRELCNHSIRASVYAEFADVSQRLLCAAGDRRRARIEMVRAGGADPDADEDATIVQNLNEWRKRNGIKVS